MMNEEPFVQIEELSKHFAVSISTIRAWVRQGHIPKSTYIKIGNTYRFNKTSVIQDVHEESTETQLEFDFNADEDV
jgi:excisionase family DNA binding protein